MLLLLLLTALTQAPTGASAPPARPATGLIAGRVIDGVSGQPVNGVVVTLVMRPGPGAPAVTTTTQAQLGGAAAQPVNVLVDGTGRFTFTALRPGSYEITAARRGFAPGAFGRLRPEGGIQWMALTENERRTDVAIRVWKHSSIGGDVRDEANEPVVGVNVFVLRRESIAGELRFNAAGWTTTDDRGAYRIGSLLPGDYLVSVPSTTYSYPLSALDLSNGPTPPPEVRNLVNQGIGGAAFIPGSRDAQRVGNFIVHEAARAPISPPPAADGTIMVYPTAYFPDTPISVATASVVAIAAGESRAIPPIRLRPSAAVRVSGTVTAPTGGSGGLTTLVLIPQHGESWASEISVQAARTITNTAGAFTFLGVTPGTYRLRGHSTVSPQPPPGFAAADYTPSTAATFWLNETVTVGSSDLTLTLVLKPALSVSGQLVFEGKGTPPDPKRIARDVVNVAPADGRALSSLTGRDWGMPPGGFTIGELPGGRYLLRSSYSAPAGWFLKSMTRDGVDAIDVPFDLTSDIRSFVVTFTDRPAVVRGSVLTTAGVADPDAIVIAFPVSSQRWTESGRTPIRMRSARVTSTGTYVINGLPPGDYLVGAVADTSAASWQTPRFLETLSRGATRIRVDDGATVTQDLRRVEVK